MFRAKRRVVVLATTVLAGAALTVVLLTGWASGGSSGVTDVAGSTSAVLYSTGHRPLAPDFTATTLTGSRLSFSAYRGQVVVVNFWGSWCGPCREEAPTLAVTAQQYRSAGVSFLGVDVRDTTASALAFAHSYGITYPSISDASSVITQDFTSAVPNTAPATRPVRSITSVVGVPAIGTTDVKSSVIAEPASLTLG